MIFSFKCKEFGREFEAEATEFETTYNITCEQDKVGAPVWSSDTFPDCNCKFFWKIMCPLSKVLFLFNFMN